MRNEAGASEVNPTPHGSGVPASQAEEVTGLIPAQFQTVLPCLTQDQIARLAGLLLSRASMCFESVLKARRSREVPLVAFSVNGSFQRQAAELLGCGGWLTCYVNPNDGGENEPFHFGFDAPEVSFSGVVQPQQGSLGERLAELDQMASIVAKMNGGGGGSMAGTMREMMATMMVVQKMTGMFQPQAVKDDGFNIRDILEVLKLGRGLIGGGGEAAGTVQAGLDDVGTGGDVPEVDAAGDFIDGE